MPLWILGFNYGSYYLWDVLRKGQLEIGWLDISHGAVRQRRVELLRPCGHKALNLACIPISALARFVYPYPAGGVMYLTHALNRTGSELPFPKRYKAKLSHAVECAVCIRTADPHL